jgi:hypothetical protein
MRATIALSAVFAASALAGPLRQRAVEVDYVTDTTEVVVTVLTTVYGSPSPSAEAPVVEAPVTKEAPPAPAPTHVRHGWTSRWSWTSSWEVPASSAPTSTVAPPPESSSSSSSYVAPASSSAITTSAAAPSSTGSSGLAAALQAAVDRHNYHRGNHSDTGDLTWDDDLASAAQTVANNCDWDHNTDVDGGASYGQNYAALPAGTTDYESSIDMWYSETSLFLPSYYGQMDPTSRGCSSDGECPEYGHFTQMIWKASEKLGCAIAKCSSYSGSNAPDGSMDPVFVVCNYSPPGNVNPEYAAGALADPSTSAWASSVGYPGNLAAPTGTA